MSGKPACLTAMRRPAVASLTLVLALAYTSPLAALEEQKGEAEAIKACDQRLCSMLMQKNPSGPDLKCDLTKTWARTTIKEADSATVKWGFGDARCTVHINLSRALIVGAVTRKEMKVHVPPTTANCLVEHDGVLKPVAATLAPKITFKDGKAEKVWINLEKVEGPGAVKATLQSAAQLQDGLGLFQRPMVKAINRFIARHCPTTYPHAAAK